nr:sorting and assembly machinery component 50 homolog B-like [Ipomoea batatas]GMD86354.1 sorting and assembly machinery component 50 homolog B-like [Ipomoea batatas]GME13678.1 sorting and assembly machinery component 50 homolog B-like [Ipomoea batatas]GME15099.1 sorting and assembly machinery component 50 homolog B-like [Ipomoea batatas]
MTARKSMNTKRWMKMKPSRSAKSPECAPTRRGWRASSGDWHQNAGASPQRVDQYYSGFFYSVNITLDAGRPELPGTTNVIVEVIEAENPITGSIEMFSKPESYKVMFWILIQPEVIYFASSAFSPCRDTSVDAAGTDRNPWRCLIPSPDRMLPSHLG